MKCSNPECDNEVVGKAKTCSTKCRVALHRASVTQSDDVTVEEPSVTLTQAMLDGLPTGVVRSIAQPGDDGRLPRRGWQSTRTYAQVIHNLLTLTLDELKEIGQWIPVWRYARG